MARMGIKKAQEAVKAAETPPELAYLLVWYLEIRAANPRGFHVEPISHTEILAYKILHELDLDSFDTEVLRQLDAVFLECLPKPENRNGSAGRQNPLGSGSSPGAAHA